MGRIPDYDEIGIEESVSFYLDIGKAHYMLERAGVPFTPEAYTVDNFIRVYDSLCTKPTRKQFTKALIEIRDNFVFDGNNKTIINKLLGDRKLYNKVKFCNDGSHRNNRIWGLYPGCEPEEYSLSVDCCIPENQVKGYVVEGDNIKCYIDYLYNNFDTIFIQVPLHNTAEEINKSICLERNFLAERFR